MNFNYYEFVEHKLGELLDIKYGKDHKHLAEGSIPVYGSGGLMRYAEKPLYEKESILIPRKGSLNNIYYMDKPFWTVDTMFYSKIQSNVVGKFLYFYLKTIDFVSMNVGSAVPSMTIEILKNLEIPLPNLTTQTRIAAILTSLDDKIELNRQTNATLEAMAQTLFQEMCLPKKGEDMEEWREGKFEDVAEQVKANINPSQSPQKLFHHYSLPAFDSNEVPAFDLGETIMSNKTMVKKYSVLFSKLNPRIPRIWSIGNIDTNVSICSTEFIGFVPKQTHYYSFINYFLKQSEVINKLTGHATGTSSSHQRVKPSDLLALQLRIPPDESLQVFETIVRPFLERRFTNIEETQTLTTLRDSLLPKLMRGEIGIH